MTRLRGLLLMLVLVGPADGPELERWRAHAERAGVSDRVEIPGHVQHDEYERGNAGESGVRA